MLREEQFTAHPAPVNLGYLLLCKVTFNWHNSYKRAVYVQVTLEPYERDHAMVVGVFRPPPKAKA